MKVTVPYITIESLDKVLGTLESAAVITTGQRLAVYEAAGESVETLKRKSREESETNALRNECLRLARLISEGTRAEIKGQLRDIEMRRQQELAALNNRRRSHVALVWSSANRELLDVQMEIDNVNRSLRYVKFSTEEEELLARRDKLQHRRAEIKARARQDEEKEHQEHDRLTEAARKRLNAEEADAATRLRCAHAALEVTRQAILAAAPGELPAILDSLHGKEGGAQ